MKAKGYSKTSQKYVEGVVCHWYSNGIGVITPTGIVFLENGEYELIAETRS